MHGERQGILAESCWLQAAAPRIESHCACSYSGISRVHGRIGVQQAEGATHILVGSALLHGRTCGGAMDEDASSEGVVAVDMESAPFRAYVGGTA
jgi:hypothetical protein